MSDVVVRTTALGGGPLARAAAAGELPAWYPSIPGDAEAWRARMMEVRDGAGTGWLDRLAPAMQASGAAAARLDRVRGGAGVVVTTGQQPGLFGGPVYTWSKAIGALAYADALQATTGIPAAPVFWAATDDADFQEAATTWIALDGGATELRMTGDAGSGLPMSEVPVDDLTEQLGLLRRAGGSAAWAFPLELAERAYASGATVGGAYLALLRGILEPLGIAVLDASHEAVRAASRPVLQGALRRAGKLNEALAIRTAAIGEAGFVAQVAQVDGLAPVFVYEPEGRRRIQLSEADDMASSATAVLGPNVLLRPVVERAILPTVAYLAGPGELAYFAQVSAVATALDLPSPLAVPRWSVTILEPRVRRLLEHYELTPEELVDPHAPERRLAEKLIPPPVTEALAALRDAVAEQTARLADLPGTLLPPTVPAGAARALEHALDRLERRYRAATRRHKDGEFAGLASLRGALRPGGIAQERALNLLPLLARHGQQLLDELAAEARRHADAVVAGSDPAVASPGDGQRR